MSEKIFNILDETISGYMNRAGWSVCIQKPSFVRGGVEVVAAEHFLPVTSECERGISVCAFHRLDGRCLGEDHLCRRLDITRVMTHEDEMKVWGKSSAESLKQMRMKHNWEDPKVRAFYGEK